MEVTSFDFEHRVFTLPGAYIFGLGQERKPMLHVTMGDLDAALAVDGLVREFDIQPGTNDHDLISIAQDALKYVKFISPGDSIPSEILDGSASWPIADDHYDSAKNELMLKIATWVSGGELEKPETQDIMTFLEDPEVKKFIQQGFDNAAKHLKLDSSEKVIEMLEALSREVAFIHALRDYYDWVFALRKNINAAQSLLKGDSQILENAIRANHLATDAIKSFRAKFENVDAQLDDIIAALSNLPNIIEFVRIARDDLHMGTLTWSEIEDGWRAPKFETRNQARAAITTLYAFLAQKFLRTDW